MRRWAHKLRGVLKTNSWLGVALVTPVAHFANRSVGFQTYLYAVFHRSLGARVGHVVLMPIIVAAAMATLAQIWLPLAVLAGVSLSAWYLYVARLNKMMAVGVVSTNLLLALTAVGIFYANSGAAAVVPPILIFLGCGIGQMMSHVPEPDIPPRVNGTDHWMPLAAFFKAAPLKNLGRAAFMFVAGTINELWASPRLLPILVLNGLWSLGYQPNARREHKSIVEQAIANNDPAIDCIGQGGAGASYA
jgi:hypothetical protein